MTTEARRRLGRLLPAMGAALTLAAAIYTMGTVRPVPPLMASVQEGAGPPDGGSVPSRVRAVFLTQLTDCPLAREDLARWLRALPLSPDQIAGLVVSSGASPEAARAVLGSTGLDYPLQVGPPSEAVRFVRRAGFERTPLVLLSDDAGRITRILDMDAIREVLSQEPES